MRVILALLFVVMLSLSLYKIMTAVITVPSGKAAAILRTDEPSLKEAFAQKLKPLVRLIAKFLHFEKYKREQLVGNLTRVGRENQTPEEFYAEAILYGILIALCAIPVQLMTGQPLMSIGVVAIGGITAANKMSWLNEEVQKINGEINKELPKFVRTYTHSYNKNTQIIDIFSEYRKIAGEAFARDIDVLITDLKTGNEEDALLRFADRINIPELSTFILGIIGTSKGDDQKTFFMFMSEKMSTLAYENLKKETIKRPAKIKRATMIMMVTLFVILLYPIVIDLINGLNMFN